LDKNHLTISYHNLRGGDHDCETIYCPGLRGMWSG